MPCSFFTTTLLLFSSIIPKVHAGTFKNCADLLGGVQHSESAKVTSSFIAYLERLLEQQIVDDRHLIKFSNALKIGKLINLIDVEMAATSFARRIHREGIETYLAGGNIDTDTLGTWITRTLIGKGLVQHERGEAKTETGTIDLKIEFHPVPAGKFNIGRLVGDVELTHEIEVMSTPLTQSQWARLFGENPSKFQDGEHTLLKVIGGKQVKMQPDNPVENITWWAAIAAANELSQEYGLRPAYDLSAIEWDETTRAEDGSLKAKNGEVIINAPGGDIYLAEGFRLPTAAEQEYLLRGARAAKRAYYLGTEEPHLHEHAWFSSNSGDSTCPVAILKPLYVNGKPIYDLYGNVWEWSHSRAGFMRPGKNPVGEIEGRSFATSGGSWISSGPHLQPQLRNSMPLNWRNDNTGVRFVRTLR